jgi:secondary thiamine-phosphate synthase enzyme
MKVFSKSFTGATENGTEDITKLVREALQDESALMDDILSLGERLVPQRGGFRHDDPRYSDCERGNAHAHLRTALLGRNVAVGVNQGELTLGRFQSIIFAEFDGPRSRDISVQVLGE